MRRTRDRAPTIRAQLTRIVLIPSLCFLALWLVVAAVGTVRAVQLTGAVSQARDGARAYAEAANELRAERRLSVVHLGLRERGVADDQLHAALDGQRARTDSALAEAVGTAARTRTTGDAAVDRGAAAVEETPASVAELRTDIDERATGRDEALMRYGDVLDAVQDATIALIHSTDGGENLTDAVLTQELLGARSDFARADALLAGVIAAGEMSYEETAHFTYLTAAYRDALESAGPAMHPTVRARYEDMLDLDSWGRAERLSRGVVTRPPIAEAGAEEGEPAVGPASAAWNTDIEVTGIEWDGSSAAAALVLDGLARAQTERTVDLAWSAALLRVSLGVAAAVAALGMGVAAIAVVGRSSRRLTDRLARLREQILDRDEDLPDILERAQRGQRVDVHEELPLLDECGDDEIGQVAEALDSAQVAAVEAAVRQAEIRRGANRAFLGVAFRNQTLVQRQLRLLDEIEYHEQDPEALRRLFRLDHLATRARRYADNLIILGGGQSARRWRHPRPLVDVLRAAIAETEDFERVRLTSAPRALMQGQVVEDVVHLLAELIENATQFSPAGTPVDVSCTPVVDGLMVEVEDRGLGMSEHGYAAAERTLSQPPEFDVMAMPEDPRLGLFVVARLAGRHGVRVWLRPSPYGGTRATTLIPDTLLEPSENTVPEPAPPVPAHGPTGTVAPPDQGPTGPPPPSDHGPATPVPPPVRAPEDPVPEPAWRPDPAYADWAGAPRGTAHTHPYPEHPSGPQAAHRTPPGGDGER
ncbi:nitrate- and nitrite sensing domain-containing protein [Nocardiopsis sp. NPDC050513]|uniref:sensor histidine kinase n=1 Tax=Nocardiopsis sp. NPDC050513 TaxID=3364338 RepID=UPI0037B1299E